MQSLKLFRYKNHFKKENLPPIATSDIVSKLCYNVNMLNKIQDFFKEHEPKIVTLTGLFLVAIVSFEVGILKGQKTQEGPIIIEKPAIPQVLGQENQNDLQKDALAAQNLTPTGLSDTKGDNIPTQNCAFVGSKNSNKYHLPTCQFAKRIKPENIVCFKDIKDAEAKGYLPDKGCIK